MFPYQDELENGLTATNLFDGEVAGTNLASHVAPQFEDWCRQWVRATYGARATKVGPWWGNALNELRRTGQRSSEEVDIVGMKSGRVTIVGEVKWHNTTVDANLIKELEDYKLPAMKQDGHAHHLPGRLHPVTTQSCSRVEWAHRAHRAHRRRRHPRPFLRWDRSRPRAVRRRSAGRPSG